MAHVVGGVGMSRAGRECSGVTDGVLWLWEKSHLRDAYSAVRNMRGTPWQEVRRQAHDPCMLCACAPAVYWPPLHAPSASIAMGEEEEKNSQPVRYHQRLHNSAEDSDVRPSPG